MSTLSNSRLKKSKNRGPGVVRIFGQWEKSTKFMVRLLYQCANPNRDCIVILKTFDCLHLAWDDSALS